MTERSNESLVVYIDGASKGNPGPAAIGVLIEDADGKPRVRISTHIGRATNNQAEYRALIAALEQAANLNAVHVTVKTDSELVAEQINGNYRVRNRGLIPLYERAMRLLSSFRTYSIDHIPRHLNTEADGLAKTALKSCGY